MYYSAVDAKYFYTVKGARQEPTTLNELKLLAARDVLKRSDLVWTEGMETWQPAGSTADIFQDLPPDLDAVQQTPPTPLPLAVTPPPVPEQNGLPASVISKSSRWMNVIGAALSGFLTFIMLIALLGLLFGDKLESQGAAGGIVFAIVIGLLSGAWMIRCLGKLNSWF